MDALFGLAMQGDLSVYFAAIPLNLIRPYAPEFNFLKPPDGETVVRAMMTRVHQGHSYCLWVYEKDNLFIMSDDCLQYHAYLKGCPDFVPFWVLGRPKNIDAKDVQGPVDAKKQPASKADHRLGRLDADLPFLSLHK